jgi:hypothetical protein
MVAGDFNAARLLGPLQSFALSAVKELRAELKLALFFTPLQSFTFPLLNFEQEFDAMIP